MSSPAATLRPLSFGEIFDRAVTLYVRNIVQFSFVFLVVVIPLAVAQYFSGDTSADFARVIAQLQHPLKHPPQPAPAMGAAFFWLLFVSIFAFPFANVALAIGVARAYFGQFPGWAACYRAALRRWPAILGITGLAGVVIFACAIGGTITLTFFAVLAFLAVRSAFAAGVVLIIVLAVAALAFVAFLVVLVLVILFAFYAVGIEDRGVFDALGSGFARIVNRREIGRALLLALAMLAMEFGLLLLFGLAEGLAVGYMHSKVLFLAVNSLSSVASGGFTGVLAAIYYYDVRVRREGLDLQSGLDALVGQPSAS